MLEERFELQEEHQHTERLEAGGRNTLEFKTLTWRLGTQVGLSPLLSRSISSARSEHVVAVTCSGVLGLDGLSGTGPSQSSVRMLSSESFLERRMSCSCRPNRKASCLKASRKDT